MAVNGLSMAGIRFGGQQARVSENFPTRRQQRDPFKRALTIRERTQPTGFYEKMGWGNFDDIYRHWESELKEFRETVVKGESKARQQDEMGDVLYIGTLLAAFQGINAKEALHGGSDKFTRRFHTIEQISGERWPSRPVQALTADEWKSLWKEAKVSLGQ